MNILGGTSTYRTIRIWTDQYVAEAHASEEGKVTCSVRAQTATSEYFFQYAPWWVPKIARVAYFLYTGLGRMGRIIALIFIGWMLSHYLFRTPPTTAPQDEPLIFTILSFVLVVACYALVAILAKMFIAPWHGAEHMAIKAYNRTKSADYSVIRKENPIADACGHRFYTPIVAGSILINELVGIYGFVPLVLKLIVVELVFRFDDLLPWSRVPVMAQASRLLQRFATTTYPHTLALFTAQAAIEQLMLAHNETDPLDDPD